MRTKRETLVELDRRHLWHPFTQMQEYAETLPVIIERGAGNQLIDVNGRRYLDGVSSLWCNLFGHRHPRIDRAVRAQLRRIAHSTLLGIANRPAIELAERLVRIAPAGLSKVFYSDDGSTAVEVALKMAYQYWQQAEGGRHRSRISFLTLQNGYHGDTIGSVSLGGIDLFHGLYQPLLFKTYRAPSPYCYRCPLQMKRESCEMECAGEVEKVLRRNQHRIAALVMEPVVQGAAGMIVQPDGYVRRMREICDRYGVFLVLDEVATGFGRTGWMFACQRDGVTPDFLCLSKGLTSGYLPMGATLTTERVYEGFLGRYEEFKTFFHGHTYTGNPLAASAALETLRIFDEDRVLPKVQDRVRHLSRRLSELAEEWCVGDIRQAGLMVGIEMVRDRRRRTPFAPERRLGHRICLEARRHKVLIRPLGDVVVLVPPLSIRAREIDQLVHVVGRSIRTVVESERVPVR